MSRHRNDKEAWQERVKYERWWLLFIEIRKKEWSELVISEVLKVFVVEKMTKNEKQSVFFLQRVFTKELIES